MSAARSGLWLVASWLLISAPRAQAAEPSKSFDLILSGGRVVDGTGAPWFRADVGIRGATIAAVGDLTTSTATRRVDLGGKMIAPGFIDMLGQSELNVLVDARVESKIRQGITTEITGEGWSAGPTNATLQAEMKGWLDAHHLAIDWQDLAGYFRRVDGKSAINIGTFVGAASVRSIVLGLDDVQPTPQQLAEMGRLVEVAMRQGALGVSSALIYPPGSYAKTAELVALAKVAARYGGVYATHMRNEEEGFRDALKEALTIGREAGIAVEVWHLKVAERKNWGRMKELLGLLEAARREGVDVTANMYPYPAASNGLAASIPTWAQAGGTAAMVARFHDPAQRARIIAELNGPGDLAREGADTIMLTSFVSPALKKYAGQRLDAVAKALGKSAAEAMLDLVEADQAQTMVVRFLMSEDDVRLGLAQPWISFCTDMAGQAVDGPFAGEMTHPRAFGSAARMLGYYARDQHLFSVEEAVRKMTSLPARRMKLFDRGVIRPGMAADLTVFDPASVRDVATFEDPLRYAVGIDTVVVNGQLVLDGGRMTAARPGRALRGPGAAAAPH